MNKEILQEIQQIIYQETNIPVEILTPEKSMSSLDIDSLSTIAILVNIETEFDVELVDDMSDPDTTIEELVAAVIKRKEN